jgi:hypothetical protein
MFDNGVVVVGLVVTAQGREGLKVEVLVNYELDMKLDICGDGWLNSQGRMGGDERW